MAPRTLTVSSSRDLLALVPFQLGFVPERSIVVICLRGQRRRVGLIARVDLPPADLLDPCLERLVAHAAQDAASSVVLLVYAPADAAAPSPDQVLATLRTCLQGAGLGVADAWHVTPERYLPLACEDPACCPVEGYPLAELSGSVVSAQMVALGRMVAPDRASALGDLRPVGADRAAQVEQVAVQVHTRQGRAGHAQRARWRAAALAVWRGELDAARRAGAEVAPGPAGALLAALDDPTVRDAVMLTTVPGSGSTAEALVLRGPDAQVQRLFEQVFAVTDPLRPDEHLLRAAESVLRSLVRQATGPRAAPPLGLLAWQSWWCGDGAASRSLVDLCLAADPSHRLALLLDQALDQGVPPGWVLRERAQDVVGQPRDG